jgi:hypothetical protein
VIGVLLLIVDAVRERSRSDASGEPAEAAEGEPESEYVEDYPEEPAVAAETEDDGETTVVEQADEEVTGEDRNVR